MNFKYRDDLILALRNYQRPFKSLCRRTTVEGLGDNFLDWLVAIEKSVVLLSDACSDNIPEDLYEDLRVALEVLDGIYDTLDCFPEVYNVENSFKIPAMPLLTEVLRRGLSEWDKEQLALEAMTYGKLRFDWGLN